MIIFVTDITPASSSDSNYFDDGNPSLHVGMALKSWVAKDGNSKFVSTDISGAVGGDIQQGEVKSGNDYYVVRKIEPEVRGPNTFYKLTLGGYDYPMLKQDHSWLYGYGSTSDDLSPKAGENYNFVQVGMNGQNPNTAFNINEIAPYVSSGGHKTEIAGLGCPSNQQPSGSLGKAPDTNGVFGKIGYVGYDIQFLQEAESEDVLSENPAIFETEPKESKDLEIYFEATGAIPIQVKQDNIHEAFPLGTIIQGGYAYQDANGLITTLDTNKVIGYNGNELVLQNAPHFYQIVPTITAITPTNLKFTFSTLNIPGFQNTLQISPYLYNKLFDLPWYNCFSFGNGVESDRVRDSFNLPQILNGVKVSTTLETEYKEERRLYGLIYSGIYNSNSGLNNLNQFIQAEKITKDINPVYGSIQKLHSRSTADGDLITLCEDRVLKILANKDAVFNADGNTNLTATAKVLGQAIPYSGEYGISENPESFASQSYRVYFTDKVRNAIIRLSKDGLTPISDYGMKDWFRDNLKLSNKLIGSFDDRNEEYNVTLDNSTDGLPKTVSFKENVRGWVSFKSFIPENGLSCANKYYTFLNGKLYLHHSEDVDRNTFYDNQLLTSFTASSVDIIFNEQPGSVKSFKTINYEGSQAKVNKILNDNGVIIQDNQYFNLKDVEGWYASTIFTDLEIGTLTDFIEKEGKWFGHIAGEDVNINSSGVITENFDTSDFSIQGIGVTTLTTTDIIFGCTDNTMFNYDPAATNDDGSCIMFNYGCMDPDADNYNAVANTDDGSCLYYGCTDTLL